jgi:putative ATP-dependent endonuclease of OLD family
MAKKKTSVVDTTDPSETFPDDLSTKLRKLIIRNFGCIGTTPVEVDLDDIVVLVGTNNAGKSTILRAYHMLFSSADPKLSISDFPNQIVDSDALPEIELHTAVGQNPPGHRWIANVDGENTIRERWQWSGPDEKAKRQGFDVLQNAWSDKVPWGAPNIANSRRPKSIRVEAFSDPEKESKIVVKLLKELIQAKVEEMPEETVDELGVTRRTDYGNLLDSLASIQTAVVRNVEDKISDAETHMTKFTEGIFPGYRVQFDARSEESLTECLNFFKAEPQLRMGPVDGHLSTADRQGSGARRTLMWSALRYAAEFKAEGESRNQFLLLLDEPELCLHPNAIREACRVLYELPQTARWQVMLTTHSPIFIDLSRDNTTVVRVERNPDSHIVTGTTVFRPSNVALSDDEKQLLKILNVFDPYVSEFFFGGKTIIVEGDTEYTAFKYLISCFPDATTLRNIHIVRARGKPTICLLTRILNQFNARYAVLHDTDTPETARKDGTRIVNPSWSNNEKIRESIGPRLDSGEVRLVGLLTNFEQAFFGELATGEKPYNAWQHLKTDPPTAESVRQLLEALVDFEKPLPSGAVDWKDIEELRMAFSSIE